MDAVPSLTCEECFLGGLQTRLEMPLMSSAELSSIFDSLTKACTKTNFSLSAVPTATSFVIPYVSLNFKEFQG
jgi:hypothetical protein